MRIFFDNVNFSSNSGPNSFGLKLAKQLSFMGHTIVNANEKPDVQLAFINATVKVGVPIVQRLDGVWFNTRQDWKKSNVALKTTFDIASSIIVQSEFNKKLIKKYLGDHEKVSVIHNGSEIDLIMSIDPMSVPSLFNVKRVWSCAAAWRPHKRLNEGIRYFLENSDIDDCLIVAGKYEGQMLAHPRVFWAGELDQKTLFSLYRATDTFISLSWLDHCPNTVCDARAAGCHIVCSSSGGTEEIAGTDSTIVIEDEWDFEPCDLYDPPQLDFSQKRQGLYDTSIDIKNVAKKYESVLQSVIA